MSDRELTDLMKKLDRKRSREAAAAVLKRRAELPEPQPGVFERLAAIDIAGTRATMRIATRLAWLRREVDVARVIARAR